MPGARVVEKDIPLLDCIWAIQYRGCLFHAENFYEIHGHYFDNGDHADSFD